MKDSNKKHNGSYLFFIAIVLFYIIFAFFNSELILDSLIEFKGIFLKIIPIIIFVFSLMYVFNVWVNPKKIAKYFGKEKGLSGWVFSVIGGMISMGAIYLWYPLLQDLKEKGMHNSLIVVFLYNRAIKIPILPFMIFYFGLNFTILLTVFMIIFSIINGLLVDKILISKKLNINKKI